MADFIPMMGTTLSLGTTPNIEGQLIFITDEPKIALDTADGRIIYDIQGVTPDDLTITKDDDGVISSPLIRKWTQDTQYLVGQYAFYESGLYRCITANIDRLFDRTKWELVAEQARITDWRENTQYLVGQLAHKDNITYRCTIANTDSTFLRSHWEAVTGVKINGWEPGVNYAVGDMVVQSEGLYYCATAHLSTTSFETAERANWHLIVGAKGEAATINVTEVEGGQKLTIEDASGVKEVTIKDGFSPLINITYLANGYDLSITDARGTQPTIGIRDGKAGESAYEIAVRKGFIGTEDDWLESIKGILSITTKKKDIRAVLRQDGWTNTLPYTQTVAVNGMSTDLNPHLDVIISDNIVTGRQEEQAFSYITKVTTAEGTITAYCYENKPPVDLNVMVEVI